MSTGSRAYRDQVFSGAVGRQRSQVLEFVRENGTATGSEVDIGLRLRGGHVRLNELHKMGLVAMCADRPCKVTGKKVQTFKVNDAQPTPKLPDLSRPENLHRLTLDQLHDMGASTAALGVLIAKLDLAASNLEDIPSGCEEILKTLEMAAETQLWTIRSALSGRDTKFPRHET